MDSTLEYVIERDYTVGGEDYNALKILQMA